MSTQCVCRLCGAYLSQTFVDLGMSPLCESYVAADALDEPEVFYPLHVRQCPSCLLVQLPAYVSGEDIFSDYAYFSSYSDSWVAHAKRFADSMIDADSASRETVSSPRWPVTTGTSFSTSKPLAFPYSASSRRRTWRGGRVTGHSNGGRVPRGKRPGERMAERYGRADLVVANNVFAHVPDIRDFAAGLRALVKDSGLVTLEFPHLLRLMQRRQFDTIYHEHYSYLSLFTAGEALASRWTARRRRRRTRYPWWLTACPCPSEAVTPAATAPRERGPRRGGARWPALSCRSCRFRPRGAADQERPARLPDECGKRGTIGCGLRSSRQGQHPAESLRHPARPSCQYTVDRSPAKQGKFLPGTHIPIYEPGRLAETRPDYILVLPWNLRDEISAQLDYTRSWGARLVFPIPEARDHLMEVKS